MKKSMIAALMAGVMLMTACGNSVETRKDRDDDDKDGSSYSENLEDLSSGYRGSSDKTSETPKPEKKPLKDLDMWEFLPEIPVTDVSAFEYQYNEYVDGIVITDFLTDETKIRIPDTIDGKPVVGLSLQKFKDGVESNSDIYQLETDSSFFKTYDITELILPETIKQIYVRCVVTYSEWAPPGPALNKVEYMNIPLSLMSNNAAFSSMKKLYINNGRDRINIDLFQGMEDSLETLYIPSSIKAFGRNFLATYNYAEDKLYPFSKLNEIYYGGDTYNGYTDKLHYLINDVYGTGFVINKYDNYYDGRVNVVELEYSYSDREDVIIPNGVTSIGADAFFHCDTIKTATIPASVESFNGYNALQYSCSFDGCYNLTTVYFEKGSKLKVLVGLNDCPKLEKIVLPEGLAEIGSFLWDVSAFEQCPSLKSITIPKSVTGIQKGSFSGCVNLSELKFENNSVIDTIDGFNDCTSLKSVDIPDGVTQITGFQGCTNLKSITIPGSVTYMNAFSGCKNISEITLGDDLDLKKIKLEKIFSDCKDNPDLKINYKGVICTSFDQVNKVADGYTIKDGFEIKDGVLYKYTGSESTVFIPVVVTEIGEEAFRDCTTLTNVMIPNSVTKIGAYSFSGCTGLTSIKIPGSVSEIGTLYTGVSYWPGGAFSGCTNLTSVEISYGVKIIGSEAFSDCSNLTRINIPDSVTDIGYNAFFKCTKLNKISLPDNVKLMDTYMGRNYEDGHAVLFYDPMVFEGCGNINVTYKGKTYDYEHIFDLYEAVKGK